MIKKLRNQPYAPKVGAKRKKKLKYNNLTNCNINDRAAPNTLAYLDQFLLNSMIPSCFMQFSSYAGCK
jgi:hypothetical protein